MDSSFHTSFFFKATFMAHGSYLTSIRCQPQPQL